MEVVEGMHPVGCTCRSLQSWAAKVSACPEGHMPSGALQLYPRRETIAVRARTTLNLEF